MDWRVLLSLTLIVSPASAANTTRCFECSDLPHPEYCERVTQCTESQNCMLDEIVTSGGLVLYNSGCMSPARCSAGKRRDISNHADDDVTSCVECCAGDFCNNQGCGTVAKKPPDRGPLCFQCDYLDAPDKCRTVVQCDIGEVCMLREWSPVVADGRSIYRSSCQKTEDCTRGLPPLLVGKRGVNGCHTCCKEDFCNDKCHPASTAQSLHNVSTSTSTTAPSTSLTSNPTTTLASITPISTTSSKQTINPVSFKELCKGNRYNYDEHSQLCYAIHGDFATWDRANIRCKDTHGMLAVADTPEKWNRLQQIIIQHYKDPPEDVFIGGKGHGTHTEDYHWTNGARFEFSAWGHGQPVSSHGRCVVVYGHGRKWHIASCGHPLRFVCTMEFSSAN